MTPQQKGVLYLLPCPITDQGDVWDYLPAANGEIIKQLDYFIVENVRTARRFLSKCKLSLQIDDLEFVELNEHTHSERDVEQMVKPLVEGRSAGVISEAGVPAVADPGAWVVRLCHQKGIRVVPLVGPSSIIMAVMSSGLSGQNFAFNGYLPVKPQERVRALTRLESRALSEKQSQLFIEAPYRNQKMVEDILKSCRPTTMLTIAMDITSHEEYISTKTIAQWRKSQLPDMQKRPAIFILGI